MRCIFCGLNHPVDMRIPGTDVPTCPHCVSVQIGAAQILSLIVEGKAPDDDKSRMLEWVTEAEAIVNGRQRGPSRRFRAARRRMEDEERHVCISVPCARCAQLALNVLIIPGDGRQAPDFITRGGMF